MRHGIVAASLMLLGTVAPAQAAEKEIGMIIARTGGGLWARFPQPVKEGQTVQLRAFRVGENVGTARIEWASPLAPYEALLTDVKPARSSRAVAMQTPYQRLVGERKPGTYDDSEVITVGYFVAATAAEKRPDTRPTDPLATLLSLLRARDETRPLAEQIGSPTASSISLTEAADALERHRFVEWSDPVSAWLVARLKEQVSERGGGGGLVTGDWFPADLAKQKPQESATNP